MDNLQKINMFLEKGILPSPDLLEEEINPETLSSIKDGLFYLDTNMLESLQANKQFDKADSAGRNEGSVKVVFSYKKDSAKNDYNSFVSHFNKRYDFFRKLLVQREDLRSVLSINKIKDKQSHENVSLIGIVHSKEITKNKNIILGMEDTTGLIKVLVSKNNKAVFEASNYIVEDEVIGVTGMFKNDVIFATNIVFPEINLDKELKKAKEESYAIFLSDIHVGSKNFLPKEFNKFLKWINMEYGNENQRSIASKVKYIFIIGDLVDGVGIYPDQEKELEIKDIYGQYAEAAKLLDRIPKHMKIIICPGNHDAMRISEPQPPLYSDFAEPLYKLENAIFVSNPALVNIGAAEDFSGIDVLLYHGYSFDYYYTKVDSLRLSNAMHKPEVIMKFLLRKRHLAPTHGSTLYIPDSEEDPLIISRIPDIFACGHIHKCTVSSYRNISLICGSCWQARTKFQEKVGHEPEPARIPIINLKTRQAKILKFGD